MRITLEDDPIFEVGFNDIELADAVIIADNYKAVLAEEPDNFAYELSLITINKHIAELQHQLRREKEIREKEIIEFRLSGEIVKYGTVPLSILGDLIRNIADSVLSASYKIKKGINPKGAISKDIINTLDLRFAGIGPGSTRLFLTGKNLPDIFGHSLIEKSLEEILGLLNSKNHDELTEFASNIGIKSVQKIIKFLGTLNNADLEIEILWTSPSGKVLKWDGNSDNILWLSDFLEKLREVKSEYISYVGELIMGSLESRFKIKDETGTPYLGDFPDELKEDIKKFHLGDKVAGIIQKNVIINQITGLEKTNYTLLKIKKNTG
jgi:hypothetical protein